MNSDLIQIISKYIPDFIVRWGIKRELKQRLYNESLKTENVLDLEEHFKNINKSHENIGSGVDEANEQHYMVPTDFFKLCLLGACYS